MVGWGKLGEKIIQKITDFFFQTSYLSLYDSTLESKINVFRKKIIGDNYGY
jgi:hypothetical protein